MCGRRVVKCLKMKLYGTVILFVISITSLSSATKGNSLVEEEVIALANGLRTSKRSEQKSIMTRLNDRLRPILRTLENVDSMLRSTRNLDVFKCMERVSCEMMAPLRAREGSAENFDEFSTSLRSEFVDASPEKEEEEEPAADEAAAAPAAATATALPQHFVQPFITPGIHYFAQPVGVPFQFNPQATAAPAAAAAVPATTADAEEANRRYYQQQYYYPQQQQQQQYYQQQAYAQQYAQLGAQQAYAQQAYAQYPQQQYVQYPQQQYAQQYYTQHPTYTPGAVYRNPVQSASRRSESEGRSPSQSNNLFSSYSSYKKPSEIRRNMNIGRRRRKMGKRNIFRRLFRGKRDVMTAKTTFRRRFKRGIIDRIRQGVSGKKMVDMLDRMMEGSNDSLYPYTRAALMGYMGEPETCAEQYPRCPTNMDQVIDTFNNLRTHFPNGIPFKERLPFPFNVILP